MKKIIIGLLFCAVTTQAQYSNAYADTVTQRIIVVLGSSTAAGTGPTSKDSAWVNRFRAYVISQDSTAQVVNLAVGGYTTYDIMPTDYTPPANRPTPKTNNNVTRAMTYNPDAIIINLPSNDAANGYSITEQLSNYDTVLSRITKKTFIWVSTTQPRNLNANGRASLMVMRDSTYVRFQSKAIDFWTDIADSTGMINPAYGSGDGIHLNNAAHRILNERVIAAGVWSSLLLIAQEPKPLPTAYQLEQNYPNPFNPETTIRYTIPLTSQVVLKVYNIIGQEVATLVNQQQNAGEHEVHFGAHNISSGVYIYRIQAGNFSATMKMLLTK